MERLSELLSAIRPFVLGWISAAGGGSGPFAPSPHDLNSAHHTGSIADSQAPQFLLSNGGRTLTGNLPVSAGITIDGVDISVLAAEAFVTIGNTSGLPNERALTAGSGLTLTDGGANGAVTIALNTPGSLSATSTNSAAGNHTHAIDSTIARSAITVTGAGALGGGGALTANRTITMNTPGTLTVSSTNSATTNHTHAITTSSTGTATTIVATNSSGGFTLTGLLTANGGVALGVQPSADSHAISRNYINSRGMNLVANGSGLLGSNYNFSQLTFDSVETHGGGGSFKATTAQVVLSDEYIAVDTTRYYRGVVWLKNGDADGSRYDAGAGFYAGVACYDIDKLAIHPWMVLKYTNSTDTTLASPLNNGDSTMTLTDATGWQNGGDSSNWYTRQIAWWPYTNSKGYSYPNYSYTRNISPGYAAYGSPNGMWSPGGISGNTVTLTAPWPGPNLPAGTPVRNATSGYTYVYFIASNVKPPQNVWTRYEGVVTLLPSGSTGWNTAGFMPGTTYIRLLCLMNYSGYTTNNQRISDIWLTEVSSRNLEAATSTVPGVVSTSAQTFAGDKTFNGNVFVLDTLGVGTSSPGAKVEFYQQTSNTDIEVRLNTVTASRKSIILFRSGGSTKGAIYTDAANNLLQLGSDASTPRVTVITSGTGAGNVGIGTSAPVAALDVNGTLNMRGNLLPHTTDMYDIGSSTRLWRKGWLSELDAVTFAENTVSVVGGWLMVPKRSGVLPADVAAAATQINFGQAMTSGEFVLFRVAGQVEYLLIGSLVSGTTYNVTRNLDGTGANDWPAGATFVVLGVSGDGRIELNAYDTPRISLIRQGAMYNAQTEIVRIGDLNGMPGVSSETWGMFIGDASQYLKYANGTLTIAGNGSGLTQIDGGNIQTGTVTAAQINVSTLSALTANMGSLTSGSIVIGTTNKLWLNDAADGALNIGGSTKASAPFRVTATGALTATNATITGAITATSGDLGALSISGKLTMSGAGSAIAIGTTPPTSATSGTGIWIDRTGYYGLNAGTYQVKIDATDGKLYAGGGKIALASNGITMFAQTAYDRASALTFYDPVTSRDHCKIYTTKTSPLDAAFVQVSSPANSGSGCTLLVSTQGGGTETGYSKIELFTSYSGTPTKGIRISDRVEESNSNVWVKINADVCVIDNGLNVGTATGAAAGQIKASGDVFALNLGKGLQAQLNDVSVISASGNVNLTSTYQDMTGLTTGSFTPAVNEYALVILQMRFSLSAGLAACNTNDVLAGVLDVYYGGADHLESSRAGVTADGGVGSMTAVVFYKVALTAGTTYTLNVKVRNDSGSRGQAFSNSQMTVWRIAR